ncbi:hypothetical protein [Polluticaenibacter yanchengensis]|uniref:Uncharacterized protein n=1 Tax=Polluticaenibacter yanchengensis TaxID=3014562 RepID=A0ABT4UMT7_9BACT|nr:hypothetical protein [Chitinophagaceae bacterium LY-5]
MNKLQTLARKIIKSTFHLSVCAIEKFHDIDVYDQKCRKLEELPEGTLGKDVAKCLKKNNLRLVPHYESHDLKHVLLDYKMTPVDEIRLQAFMIGNRNYTIPSFAIFIFGAFLLPDLWATFYTDFKNGRKAKPIKNWTIEEFASCPTSTLRQIVFNYSTKQKTEINMKSLIKFGAYTAIILGAFGMMFCLPFLFSSNLTDLVGAGFAFIGGAIIASSGLLTLSNITSIRKQVRTSIV